MALNLKSIYQESPFIIQFLFVDKIRHKLFWQSFQIDFNQDIQIQFAAPFCNLRTQKSSDYAYLVTKITFFDRQLKQRTW